MRRRARHTQGLTLVEAALLLSVLGVLLAVGLPAFVRGLRTNKTEEAALELDRMFAAVAAYYASPQPTAAGKRLRCLPVPAGPTPAQPAAEPTAVVMGAPTSPGAETWRAIGYEPTAPIRFRYSLLTLGEGCGVHAADTRGQIVVTLRAEGDLDGDGVLSRFERNASVRDGELALEPLLVVHDRVE